MSRQGCEKLQMAFRIPALYFRRFPLPEIAVFSFCYCEKFVHFMELPMTNSLCYDNQAARGVRIIVVQYACDGISCVLYFFTTLVSTN